MVVEKTLSFQNRKIFYRVAGEGPAVVLLHGIPADGDLWRNQLHELKTFKFIVPDLPGSGMSERIDDTSMEGMAEAIRVILDTEKIPSAAMIGHSMGGYVSLAFAEKNPERLNGLGLFHSTAYPDSEERKTARRTAIETVKKNGAFAFLKTSVPNLFSPHHKEKNVSIIEELIAKTNNFSSNTFVSYYEAMMKRSNRTTILKNLKIPMLFIAGKYDTAVPLDDILELCHLPEKSYFHTLCDSAHMGMLEETKKSNAILNDYLTDLT